MTLYPVLNDILPMFGTLRPGDHFDARYLILREIGRGGFGVVYQALQERLGREVAIKLLDAPVRDQDGFIKAFRHEALHTSKLSHPNTITLYDYGEDANGAPYLVMELLEGETLHAHLDRNGPMEESRVLDLALQLAGSLAEAHNKGIIHGDLKPANLMLCNVSGESDFIKVLDFGVARLVGNTGGRAVGTLHFMSPEQFAQDPTSTTSDVYSVGLLLEVCLEGLTVSGSAIGRLTGSAPLELSERTARSGLADIVARALAREPAARFKDGDALFKALRALAPKRQRHGDFAGRVGPEALSTRPTRFGTYTRRQRASSGSSSSITPVVAPAPTRPLTSEGWIGHQIERERLVALLSKARREHRGAIVLLEGPMGIGKGRLASWLTRRALDRGERVGHGHYGRDGLGAPSRALIEAMGLDEREAPERLLGRAGAAAREMLGRPLSAPEHQGLLTILGWLPGSEASVDMIHVVWLMEALARATPLMLCIEGLETCEPVSLAILRALAPIVDRTQLTLVLTLTSDSAPATPILPQSLETLGRQSKTMARLKVGGLTEKESLMFAEMSLDEARVSNRHVPRQAPDVTRMIAQRSYGNPSYIKRLARYLVEHQLLQEGVQGLSLAEGVSPEGLIPPLFAQAMGHRIDALFEASQSSSHLQLVLLRAAMLGPVFTQSLLGFILHREAQLGHACSQRALDRLDNLVEELCQRQVLYARTALSWRGSRTRELAFTQPVLAQVLCKRADTMPDASHVARAMAGSLRRHFSDRAPDRTTTALIERCEIRALRPDQPQAPRGWESHRGCWSPT